MRILQHITYLLISMLPLMACSTIKKQGIPASIQNEITKLDIQKDAEFTGEYSPSGQLYAVYSPKKDNQGFVVRIWNSQTGKLRYQLKAHIKERSNLVNLTFSENDSMLVLGGMFGSVPVWHFKKSNRLVKSCFDGMGAKVGGFSKDNSRMYIYTADGHHKLCSTNSNYVYLIMKTGGEATGVITLEGKLLMTYADRFKPYKENDPYGLFWRIHDSNSASPEAMKKEILIREL